MNFRRLLLFLEIVLDFSVLFPYSFNSNFCVYACSVECF